MVEIPARSEADAKINAYAAPKEDGEGAQALDSWAARHRDRLLVVIYLAAFAAGFAAPSGTRDTGVLSFLIIASAISLWCTVDAKLHGKTFLVSFQWLMVWTWPVGVLAHLIWTRGGSRGVSTYVVAVLGYFLVLFLGGFVSMGLGLLLNGEVPS